MTKPFIPFQPDRSYSAKINGKLMIELKNIQAEMKKVKGMDITLVQASQILYRRLNAKK